MVLDNNVSLKGQARMSVLQFVRSSPSFFALGGVFTLLTFTAPGAGAADCKAEYLRVNQQVNPLGVDTPHPRLSWRLDDKRRGARQTAYQVLAATTPAGLREGKADLWDSGKVRSDQSIGVIYNGKPIRAQSACWWTVRVWDKDGKSSPWSKPGRWEMPLENPLLGLTDWKAQWIGMADEQSSEKDSLADAKWIWYPEGSPLQNAPAGERFFRFQFNLPNKPIKSAILAGAVDNSFDAQVNGNVAVSGAGWQTSQAVSIALQLKPGPNRIDFAARNATDGPAGLAALVRVTFADGSIQRYVTGPGWQASQTRSAGQSSGDWKPAMVIASMGDAPWGQSELSQAQPTPPSPLLRKAFTLSKPFKSARVYVTAKGSYRLHINGERVGKDILTPDWTDYRMRIPYQIYDVTRMLRQGENAVGAMLGDGWYASGLGWNLQRYSFGSPPVQLLMQMRIDYADGTRETVVTDGSWKATVGPIIRSEIYAGETYDARKEQPGWDKTGFDDHGWKPVNAVTPVSRSRVAIAWKDGRQPTVLFPGGAIKTLESAPPPTLLVPQISPTIQKMDTVKPVAITSPKPGVKIYDMGQNMVGWVRLKVRGKAGNTVRMRFAEVLQPDGNIYTQNLRSAEATDTYTLRGEGTELFEPHFTYHGFRYVEVTGYPGQPDKDALIGQVFHTAAPASGSFASSNEMVNTLWANINRGQKGNMESVPTDCPQRDERLGWMGDAGIFWPTAVYNRDMAAFTHKWMRDVVDAQSSEGAFSDVAPRVVDPADGAPAWGDAGIILPYTTWRQYGDTRIIEDNYSAMQGWVEYVHSANPNLLWLKRRNNDFGDWVAVNDTPTDKNVIATAFFAQSVKMLAQMARAIGKEDDANRYAALFDGIRTAFNKAYVKPDGLIGNGSQTCYVLALQVGLLDEAGRKEATRRLVADIDKRGGHLSTGFIGSAYLMPVLSQNGQDETAYRLLLNDTFPSWGYMIKKNATTMWERWNGDTGDPAMNSFNHYAFGAVGEWMYRYMAGIDQEAGSTGFKQIVIRPRFDKRMDSAGADYESVYGTIRSFWLRGKDQMMLRVTIPANTTATIYVATTNQNRVTENGKPIDAKSGITFLRMEDGCAVYSVEAGEYVFMVE